MKKTKVVVDFDDIHPEKGYGYYDEYYDRLLKLIQLGVIPTLFIVPKWKGLEKQDLRKHKDWLKTLNNCEFAVHGLTHYEESNPEGAKHIEFLRCNEQTAKDKLDEAKTIIFESTGLMPASNRFPGWESSVESRAVLLKDPNLVNLCINTAQCARYKENQLIGNFRNAA